MTGSISTIILTDNQTYESGFFDLFVTAEITSETYKIKAVISRHSLSDVNLSCFLNLMAWSIEESDSHPPPFDIFQANNSLLDSTAYYEAARICDRSVLISS